ncbi:MAG TPA: outer membrane protein assembly factor BamD [Polyangiaceae bacterium]
MIDARLSDAGDERERALLRVGAEEAPSARSMRAAARALGMVPGLAAFFYALTAFAKAAKWSVLVPYVLAPAVVAGAVATAYVAVERRGSTLEAAAPPGAAAMTAPRTEVAPAVAAPVAVSSPAPISLEEVAAAPRRAGSSRAPAREGADMPAQVALVDRGRSLVAAGDTAGALRAIDEYGKRFPRGALSEEAALLRIEAVYARGDRAATVALAKRFRAEYPRSVHADKIRWMLGDGPK